MPMSIRGELPCMPLSPCTHKKWKKLPHVILTSDKCWNHSSLGCEGQLDNEEWFDSQHSFPGGLDSKLFNENGENRNTSENHESHFFDTENCKEDTLDGVIDYFLS